MPWVEKDGQGHIVGIHPCEQPSIVTEYTDDENVRLWQDPKISLAQRRYEVEVGGVNFMGSLIQTDRETRANWLGILIQAQSNPAYKVTWKGADGVFVTYDAGEAMDAAFAVSAHVQKCFAAESAIITKIYDGEILTDEAAVSAFNTLME